MAHNEREAGDDLNLLHLGLYLTGGLCVGIGLLNLYWSFGAAVGDLNMHTYEIGFSGLDDLTALPPSDYAIPLVVAGVLFLVYANAIAWRKTGGY